MKTSGGWQPGPASMGSPASWGGGTGGRDGAGSREGTGDWDGAGGRGGTGSRGDVPGDRSRAAVWAYPAGPYRRGSLTRFLAWSALGGIAVVVSLIALAALVIPHTILLVILALLALPVLLLALAAGVVFWAGRRAWRSGAWMEAVPMAVGMPAAGRLMWLLRALLVGRALRRLGRRGRRPRGGYRRSPYGGYAEY